MTFRNSPRPLKMEPPFELSPKAVVCEGHTCTAAQLPGSDKAMRPFKTYACSRPPNPLDCESPADGGRVLLMARV